MKFMEVKENKEETPVTPKHTGLFYRVTKSSYYSQSSGSFHKKLEIRPLKRRSCKGCHTCDYILEMVTGLDTPELLEGKWSHGDMVELTVQGGKYWTDYGYEYDSWLEWKKVTK